MPPTKAAIYFDPKPGTVEWLVCYLFFSLALHARKLVHSQSTTYEIEGPLSMATGAVTATSAAYKFNAVLVTSF